MTTKRTVRLAFLTIPGVFVLAMASRASVGFAQRVDDSGGWGRWGRITGIR